MESTPKQLGEAYTIKWVNSGPPSASVDERTIVQHIYLDAEGGPLIHTPAQIGLDGWGHHAKGWFKAPDGLEKAIEDIVAKERANEETSTQAWLLSAIAFAAVLGLTGLGRRLRT